VELGRHLAGLVREVWSYETNRYWFRIMRRTHGVELGMSLHWPTRNWPQWQIGMLILSLHFGPKCHTPLGD